MTGPELGIQDDMLQLDETPAPQRRPPPAVFRLGVAPEGLSTPAILVIEKWPPTKLDPRFIYVIIGAPGAVILLVPPNTAPQKINVVSNSTNPHNTSEQEACRAIYAQVKGIGVYKGLRHALARALYLLFAFEGIGMRYAIADSGLVGRALSGEFDNE